MVGCRHQIYSHQLWSDHRILKNMTVSVDPNTPRHKSRKTVKHAQRSVIHPPSLGKLHRVPFPRENFAKHRRESVPNLLHKTTIDKHMSDRLKGILTQNTPPRTNVILALENIPCRRFVSDICPSEKFSFCRAMKFPNLSPPPLHLSIQQIQTQ